MQGEISKLAKACHLPEFRYVVFAPIEIAAAPIVQLLAVEPPADDVLQVDPTWAVSTGATQPTERLGVAERPLAAPLLQHAEPSHPVKTHATAEQPHSAKLPAPVEAVDVVDRRETNERAEASAILRVAAIAAVVPRSAGEASKGRSYPLLVDVLAMIAATAQTGSKAGPEPRRAVRASGVSASAAAVSGAAARTTVARAKTARRQARGPRT